MNPLIKISSLLFAFTLLATAQPFSNEMGGGLSPDDTIVYKKVSGEVTELKLHLFYPEGYDSVRSYPGIVLFFGGGWNGGTPAHFYVHAKYLASRGMIVICPDYRTKTSHGALPYQCVEDGKAAMRYVRSHAKELGLDPRRIAAGGGSAGGHVAAATATLERFDAGNNLDVSPVPDALVLFNPVYDNGPDGYGYERVKDYWEFFSPMNNLKAEGPPAIVFFGDSDKLVPVSTAEEYQRRMHELGLRSELHVFANQSHGFFNWGNDKSPDKEIVVSTFTAMDTFLASLGFLEGEPTAVEWVAAHR
ncbi:MAG: alpha/beta hydrolase [Verrucomicrobia bacterium]|nr:alpha/beta hydrolase [Verrucomicrobiota bacterium]MDA1069330.1 alpha/beta hydrolase [Verrucomicrobiota bacterium]